jgi:hypothetical protein
MSFQSQLVEAPHQRSFSRTLAAFEGKCRRVLSPQANQLDGNGDPSG